MTALLIVDIQNDFLPGGALAVDGGDEVIPLVNQLVSGNFDLIVACRDWHSPGHYSFASTHAKSPGEHITLMGQDQVLWPDHCVQETEGAEFAAELDSDKFHKVFQKGTDETIDSYSAFFDNQHLKSTGLGEYLQSQGVVDLYIVGLATDYCVKYTALDALALGFRVHIIIDACRGVNLVEGDIENAVAAMKEAGAEVITAQELSARRA